MPSTDNIADRLVYLLKHTAPFDALPSDARATLLQEALVEFFPASTIIMAHGAEDQRYLYVVESGSVRLEHATTGRLVDMCATGDVFGHWGLVRSDAVPYEARAVEATTCALISGEAFREVYDTHPAFAAFFKDSLQQQDDVVRPPLDTGTSQLLLGTTVGDLVHRSLIRCAPDATLRAAAQQMRKERVGSLVVTDNGNALGILTNSDLRDEVVAGETPVDAPARDVMSSPVIALPGSAPLFEALLTMARHRLHHLAVSGEDGEVIGMISASDIAQARGQDPTATLKRIERAPSVDELADIRSGVDTQLIHLHRQGVQARDVVRINTEINDQITVRVLKLVERQLRTDHPERYIDWPWVWMSLGSEGRKEMSLRTDQDNAIIYADPPDEETAKRVEAWLRPLAERANEALATVGYTLCDGDVMARNPEWRLPLRRWKRVFREWMFDPSPKALMNATIFFDLRALYGEERLVDQLKRDLRQALDDERGFLTFLVSIALQNTPPLTFFRRFVLDEDGEEQPYFDIKLRGLMPVTDLGRVLALDARFLESTNTLDRLEAAGKAEQRVRQTAENLSDAYRHLEALRLQHQIRCIEDGRQPDNHVNPTALTKTQQQMLKVVFSTMKDAQKALELRYGAQSVRT